MDSCSLRRCQQNGPTYVKQIRKDRKQREKCRKKEEKQFKKELNKLKKKRKKRLSAIQKAVNKLNPKDKRKCRVYRTLSKVIIARKCDCRKRLSVRPRCCLITFAVVVLFVLTLPIGPC